VYTMNPIKEFVDNHDSHVEKSFKEFVDKHDKNYDDELVSILLNFFLTGEA
jgi:hypothetical protein